jgi:hypothetical protein
MIEQQTVIQLYLGGVLMRRVYALPIVIMTIGLLAPCIAHAQIPPASTRLFCYFNPDACKDTGTNPNLPPNEPPPLGKLIINADAWIGDKPVTVGTNLKVGKNTLVISRNNVTASDAVGISGYLLPTTGKSVWTPMENLMKERTLRALATQRDQQDISNCPNKEVDKLYLQPNKDPWLGTSLPGRNDSSEYVFFPKGGACTLVLKAGVEIYGSGTFINIDPRSLSLTGGIKQNFIGGSLVIKGKIDMKDKNGVFGYISFSDSDKPNSDKGKVTLAVGSEVKDIAIFTSGTIDIQGNTTGGPKKHQTQLVSRFINFPPLKDMKSDIVFDPPKTLQLYPPPLFQAFMVPKAQEQP